MNKEQILNDIDTLKELINNIDKPSETTAGEYDDVMKISNLLTAITAEWSSYITGDLMASVIKKISSGNVK